MGPGAVNPYLALATIEQMQAEGYLPAEVPLRTLQKNFIKAAAKGLLKVISKMGISTQQSYRGAQIFEAIGLATPFVEEYFSWTASRIQGIGLEGVAEESLRRHEHAYPRSEVPQTLDLDVGGQYQWRRKGEAHMLSPEVVAKLQQATRINSREEFRAYCRLIDEQATRLLTLRGLLDFHWADQPVPLEEVEPVTAIVKRFATGAMSYGSISKEAHETLAIAMNRIGGKSNTGEGGEDAARYRPDANGDNRSSAIKQVASGRFGVTSEYLLNAQELQIKMAQGAKPGEGGQLPGHKVDKEIARIRHSTPGVGLISPPPHHDIYSIEDLAQLDSRSQEREREGSDQRQAGVRGRRRHRCRRRRQGEGRRGAHQRARRRHRRQPANFDQARRPPLGTRPCRKPIRCWSRTISAAGSSCKPTACFARPKTWLSPRCWGPRNGASPPPRWSRSAAS